MHEEKSTRDPRLTRALAPAIAILVASHAAGADRCKGSCKPNEVCVAGRCVSACNPPCGAGEQCTESGECISASAPTAPPAPPSLTPTPVRSDPAPGDLTASTEASAEPETITSKRLHYGGGMGGVYVPFGNIWALTVEGYVTIALNERWEMRPVAMYVHTDDTHTASNSIGVGLLPTFWISRYYGVAVGTLLAYAVFTQESSGGWDDSSPIFIAFAEPVRVRFGERVRHELSVEIGTGFVFTHAYQLLPWGKIAYTVLF